MGLYVQGDRTSHDQKLNRFAAALHFVNAFASVTIEDLICYDGKESNLDIIAIRHLPVTPPDEYATLLDRNPSRYFELMMDGPQIRELWHFEVKSGTSAQSLERAREQLARGREHYYPSFDRIFSYIVCPQGVSLESRLLKPPFDTTRPTEDQVREAIVEDAFYVMQHDFRYAA